MLGPGATANLAPKRSAAIGASLLWIALVGVAWGDVYLTPRNNTLLYFDPYLFQTPGTREANIETHISSISENGGGLHYAYTDLGCTFARQYTTDSLWWAMAAKFGLVIICTHGGPSGIVVEPYGSSEAAACLSRVSNLNNAHRIELGNQNGFSFGLVDDDVYPYAVVMQFAPSVTTKFRGDSSVVYIGACETDTFSWEGLGVAAWYSYDYPVGITHDDSVLSELVATLAGNIPNAWDPTESFYDPIDHRSTEKAYNLLTFWEAAPPNYHTSSGTGARTLAPAVALVEQDGEWRTVGGTKEGTFNIHFDTYVNSTGSAAATFLQNENTTYSVQSASWIQDGVGAIGVQGILRMLNAGSNAVSILGSNVSSKLNAGNKLDGNEKPGVNGAGRYAGESGVSPNEDNYSFIAESPGNPAASVMGFEVLGGVARWRVLCEYRSLGYSIQGLAGELWEPVLSGIEGGKAFHEVSLSSSRHDVFRLVETSESGRVAICGYGGGDPSEWISLWEAVHPPRQPTPAEEVVSVGELRSFGHGEKVLIFWSGEASWLPPLQSLESYWEDLGFEVTMISYGGAAYEFGRRNLIRNEILNSNAEGTRRFLIVGDANDDVVFVGSQYQLYWQGTEWEAARQSALAFLEDGQPALNIAPTWYRPDYFTPPFDGMASTHPYYMSDQPYGDLNGDYITDLAVCRWPVNNANELWAIVTKVQGYFTGGRSQHPYSVKSYVNDNETGQAGGSEYVWDTYLNVMEAVPEEVNDYVVRSTNYGTVYDRNVAAVNVWNGLGETLEPAETVLFVGGRSGSSEPCGYFNKGLASYPFHMGLLGWTWDTGCPMVIGASCGTAGFAISEAEGGMTPVCEDMLLADAFKGCIAWVGPTMGSWQEGNREVARELLRALYEIPARSMAESWVVALERVRASAEGDIEVLTTLKSYVFLGDPVTPFNPDGYDPTSVQRGDAFDEVWNVDVRPNPTSGGAIVRLVSRGAGSGSLEVFDIGGRKVRGIFEGGVEEGVTRVQWDGTNGSGERVAAGVYVIRGRFGDSEKSRKVVVVR